MGATGIWACCWGKTKPPEGPDGKLSLSCRLFSELISLLELFDWKSSLSKKLGLLLPVKLKLEISGAFQNKK